MKLSQNEFIISCTLYLIILTETNIKIIKLIFYIENWLWQSKFLLTHDQVNANSITKTTSWLKFFGKNLCLVGCATVYAKDEFMLPYVINVIYKCSLIYYVRTNLMHPIGGENSHTKGSVTLFFLLRETFLF